VIVAKAIFFDWDGTLVDSLPMLFEAHNYVRDKLGYPLWSRDEYAQAIVYSTRELYPRLYGEKSDKAREVLTDFIRANHLKRIKVMDGVVELLDHLVEHDVIMGIVSNKTHEILGIEVRHLGWDKYFGVFNGAGIAALDKPSGVPLVHALAMHPAKPTIDKVIYVGDMESDLSCAREAGCPIVFIKGTARSEELIEEYKPAYVVDNISELKDSLMDFLSKP
jgi:HAD superfamily hydrolase (TIGR01549 family)